MPINKSPAFQFYPKDFLSDVNVQLMTAEQVGAYMLLLANAWIQDDQGTLPNNDKVLAKLSRLNGRWSDVGTDVKRMFKVDEKNSKKIFHPRLKKEKKVQVKRRRQCSEAGKAKKNKDMRG